jgi:two-component system nitrate/nitrite response regulator NarL
MEETKIHLLIADDHLLFIDGLVHLLREENDIVIDGIAYDGKELLDIVSRAQPDIILLDINMPKLNGLEAARHIRRSYPLVKIIILSTYNEDYLIKKAKEHGVNGYQLKNCSKDELLQTIRLVKHGHSCFPYRQPRQNNPLTIEDNFLKQFNLTVREIEILKLIKKNYTNREVAEKLFLSVFTVDTHRKNIMQMLGLKKPSELMNFIFENGL